MDNDSLFTDAPIPELPLLPEPAQQRWQPLRLGLIELFHYDSEEFWFRDGHLLLRGNNGTGKSKVLSLTLPFLFDAQLKSSRIEPDGDATKKMAWNLLLGKHDRRIGYTWLELGRKTEDGKTEYLTLGCGLSAVAARASVDSWFFIAEGQRLGRDLWLINPQRAVLTKDRLAEALKAGGRGQVFETASAYRRAVDERLFHLGEVRYGALMDTLIQLRQPQLSKRPNEDNLSSALTEALPPLPDDLLGDVADAMNQLEEYRAQLAELAALGKAIGQFNRRYLVYAQIAARRQARGLRSAQTSFEAASRELNEAKTALEAAQLAEQRHREQATLLDAALLRERATLDELQADPVMRDARRLEETERNAAERKRDVAIAEHALQSARQRLQTETTTLRQAKARAEQAQDTLNTALAHLAPPAAEAGLAGQDEYAQALDWFGDPQALAHAGAEEFGALQQSLRDLTLRRRTHIAQWQRRQRAHEAAERERAQEQRQCNERADELQDASAQAEQAEQDVARRGSALGDAWLDHFDNLIQLQIDDAESVLAALADWVANLEGDNPAREALQAAQQAASSRLAEREAALRFTQATLESEAANLRVEASRLESGEDKIPAAPPYRDGASRLRRPGAPLWQLVEFRQPAGSMAALGTAELGKAQAGLEAALEAAGLLDAWLCPDGALLAADSFDTVLQRRAPSLDPQCGSLADWLTPAQSPGADGDAKVDAGVVAQILQSIACGEQDAARAEAWVSPRGQFRLGPLAGAWNKDAAEYIGFAARLAARQRRLLEIAAALAALTAQLDEIGRQQAELAAHQQQAALEWRSAPSEDLLRAAHVAAVGLEKQRRLARDKLLQAEQRLKQAEDTWRQARDAWMRDAEDLHLPLDAEALAQVERALGEFERALQALLLDAHNLRHALPECERQAARQEEAQTEVASRGERLAECTQLAEQFAARLQILRESVGAKVEELKLRLSHSRNAVEEGDKALKLENKSLSEAGEQRARNQQRVEDSGNLLEERSAARQQAILALQRFINTGLLAVALPDLEQPPAPPSAPGAAAAVWGIDAALTLARRTEQALVEVSAEDQDWNRMQTAISRDYTELSGTLTSLGHQAQAETSDYGYVITIVYQNRPQRPDVIENNILEEIAQRRELLTAREREVLENHLQAEVAAAVQRLLQDSERRLAAINFELDRRPTSTGVKFRLVWQPLAEGGDDGAPVGLEAARKKLLNTSADAWSAQDRKVVGDMLQNRIIAERARTDADGSGSLLEMLARALDYRRWHRFRVQRWQDGQWRALSGPASSGERALGLTVPLFAAVSSFYSHGDYQHSPRLVLLDEAFAGIDDAARAHCMGLVKEFDLDFVMTSEREWACYAELPGVSICQLQRHEGIDAVYVSRWAWDGRARRAERDGARRFPPSE